MILSSSNDDIKIWNYKYCEKVLTISKIFDEYNGIFSSCIIFNKKDFYIFCVGNCNHIKLYDSKGKSEDIGERNE